jgi:type I restriction enzyme, R subunit
VFHAINQFRVDTPGCVKKFIIPDIVLFVNGIPLVAVEAKVGDANTANPMDEAYEQLLRYRNGRESTREVGLREGEVKLFHTNHLLISTCGEMADFGTISSAEEYYYAWRDVWPEESREYSTPLGVEREQEKLISRDAGSWDVVADIADLYGVYGY